MFSFFKKTNNMNIKSNNNIIIQTSEDSSININGKSFTGNNFSIVGDKITIDGNEQSFEASPNVIINTSEGTTIKKVQAHNLTVNGDISGDVNSHNLTSSGNIIGNITSHNTICQNVEGDISGHKVEAKNVTGKIDGKKINIENNNKNIIL